MSEHRCHPAFFGEGRVVSFSVHTLQEKIRLFNLIRNKVLTKVVTWHRIELSPGNDKATAKGGSSYDAENDVRIPRFFYRDTQKAMAEIQASIEQCGSVREAMTQRIAPYAGLLPEDSTVELVVNQIEETASMFCATEAQITGEDVRRKLEEAIGQYTEEEAFYYLSILETTVSVMDASADDQLILPDAETIQAEIEEKLANPGELSLAERSIAWWIPSAKTG